MKLIIGLGNPGAKYEGTRHNVGFTCLDRIAEYNNVVFKQKFNGYSCEFASDGEKIILLKPDTFMNNSGEAVTKYLSFYKCNIEDVLVIYDDLDLDFGKIRIKGKSSSGGHNGIKSIINHLKTEEFLKVKIGINNEYKKDVKNFVLSNFSKEEKGELVNLINVIDEIAGDFIKGMDGVSLMNKYN
jgi:PTH1 family peptidyl-tRNA hydrolase